MAIANGKWQICLILGIFRYTDKCLKVSEFYHLRQCLEEFGKVYLEFPILNFKQIKKFWIWGLLEPLFRVNIKIIIMKMDDFDTDTTLTET